MWSVYSCIPSLRGSDLIDLLWAKKNPCLVLLIKKSINKAVAWGHLTLFGVKLHVWILRWHHHNIWQKRCHYAILGKIMIMWSFRQLHVSAQLSSIAPVLHAYYYYHTFPFHIQGDSSCWRQVTWSLLPGGGFSISGSLTFLFKLEVASQSYLIRQVSMQPKEFFPSIGKWAPLALVYL